MDKATMTWAICVWTRLSVSILASTMLLFDPDVIQFRWEGGALDYHLRLGSYCYKGWGVIINEENVIVEAS